MDQFKINGEFTTMKAVPDCTRKGGKSEISHFANGINNADATRNRLIHMIQSNNVY